VSATTVGVYPGSFDPLTIAHLAIAEAAVRSAHLDRIDLALSNVALGKEQLAHSSVEARAAAIRRAARSRRWLDVAITDAQLIADIASGYDVVVMGADKWEQVRDPVWYGGDATTRDAALASLPRVLVARRPGFDVVGAEELDVDPTLAHVSSTRARSGEHHLIAPEAHVGGAEGPRRLVVDGNNVIGSRPDGWWRDRAGAARRLVADLDELVRHTGDDVMVVFDGRPGAGLAEGRHDHVRVAYARRAGRDAGDDRIVEEIAGDDAPSSLTVVTSDRALAQRARELGAQVDGAGALTRELGWERP
jgi:nicotinic acid mononucleotide adenylyltransferase/predicted RNA-binding protein with PIN domain